jgi:apolipoprotein N-acyltransferase
MAFYILVFVYSGFTVGLLYFFIREAQKKYAHDIWPLKKHLLMWVLFGFVFNLFSFSWLYTTYPILWLKEGSIQLLGIFVLHLIIALISSLGFCIVGFNFSKHFSLHLKSSFKPFVFASSLTLAETLRAYAISLLYYGKDTTIDLNYTASALGDALAPTPFVEFAYFGGVFTLTFILGYVLYCITSKKLFITYWKHLVGIFLLFIIIHIFVPTYGPEKNTNIVVITTNSKSASDTELQEVYKKSVKEINTLLSTVSDKKPDIIVFPEDTRYLSGLKEGERQLLTKKFPETLFIDGDTTILKDMSYANVSLFYSARLEKSFGRGKDLLFPFNEYIPMVFRPVFSFFVPEDDFEKYKKNHTYTPVYSQKTIQFKGNSIGTIICYELTSHRIIQELRSESPSIVFFQSRLNVFHDTPWFNMHTYLYAKVTAAQLRRPLLSAINNAPSFIISPRGIVFDVIPTGFNVSRYTVNSRGTLTKI